MQFRPWSLMLCAITAVAVGCGDDPPALAPRIVILSPDDGAVLATTTAAIEFRVEDAAATSYDVTVGGAATTRVDEPLAIGREVTVPVKLVEGVNPIELAVHADTGTARETVVLVVQLAPVARPEVAIVSPAQGALFAAPAAQIAIEIRKAPASGLRVRVGAAAPVEIAETIAEGGTRSVDVALVSGVNTIAVDALDAGGVASSDSVVVVVDETLPVVEIAAPAALTHAATAAVTGRVTTPRTIASATARTGDGAPAALVLTPIAGGFAFTGEVALAIGKNDIVVEVLDDLGRTATASVAVVRERDDEAPAAVIAFPRDGQAVRTRRVIVRGTATDASRVASITLALGAQQVAAEVDAGGAFTAALELAPADNAIAVTTVDGFGNAATTTTHIYYGQRLGSGGGHGGAIRDGRILTWGRNNLAQTGQNYLSHENRTAHCDRTLTSPREIAQCKATTVTAIDAICVNPGFVTPAPPDSPEAAACRAATRARRDQVCAAAGAAAPPNCLTSAGANLATACDAAFGADTPASSACEAGLACDGAYAAGSSDHAACVAIAGRVPSVFPAPRTPYAPVALDAFSPAQAPATPDTIVRHAALGVSFVTLSFNQNASSAIDSAGALWGWGDNASGQLCLGDRTQRLIPHRVDPFGAAGTTAIGLARGFDHVLVLRSDGSVWGCGLNNVGQIGDGTSGSPANDRAAPTQVLGLPADIVQVLASSQSSYALTSGGQVYAWGRNQFGNLGQGTSAGSTAPQPTPLVVPGLSGVVMIAAGRDHVLAVTSAGAVFAWGLNASNQVNGSADDVLSPVQIAGVTDARAVYANGTQGFYEDAIGRLFGWGGNGNGNLGIPQDEDQPAPTVPVFGLSSVLDVGIGALQGFAMRGDQIFAWGWSFHGSLGAGDSAIHTWPYRTPILVRLP